MTLSTCVSRSAFHNVDGGGLSNRLGLLPSDGAEEFGPKDAGGGLSIRIESSGCGCSRWKFGWRWRSLTESRDNDGGVR